MDKSINWFKSLREDVLNLHEKVERQIEAQYEAKGHTELDFVLAKIEELRKEIRMLDPQADIYEPVCTESEQRLVDIESSCRNFAKEVIDKACKRAIRQMNKWTAALLDPMEKFPSTFRVFDILSVELQSNYYCDINPMLEDTVENLLWGEYKELPYKERFFVEYSECSYSDCLDDGQILKLLQDHFMELINEHWANTKKIQDFEIKKSW